MPTLEGRSRFVPISEPPREIQPSTSSQETSRTAPRGLSSWWRTRPGKPLWMAIGLWPLARQYATAARVAEFIPPAGAPTWMRAIFMCYFGQTRGFG